MDRTAVTSLVEDYWRAYVSASQTNIVVAMKVRGNFDRRIGEIAALMEPREGRLFLQAVELEREKILDEYSTNPAALKRRLGIPLGNDAPASYRNRPGSNLGGLVVRTAVRATIWEAIWALFRLGR